MVWMAIRPFPAKNMVTLYHVRRKSSGSEGGIWFSSHGLPGIMHHTVMTSQLMLTWILRMQNHYTISFPASAIHPNLKKSSDFLNQKNKPGNIIAGDRQIFYNQIYRQKAGRTVRRMYRNVFLNTRGVLNEWLYHSYTIITAHILSETGRDL